MALLLHTAGRREDAVRLGPQHTRNGRVRFTQAKNEHRKPVLIDIPLSPELARTIEATPTGHLVFLVNRYGKPLRQVESYTKAAQRPGLATSGMAKLRRE